MEAIITAVTDVTSLMSSMFSVMTGNAYFVFLLAAGLVGIGLSIFRAVKHTAR